MSNLTFWQQIYPVSLKNKVWYKCITYQSHKGLEVNLKYPEKLAEWKIIVYYDIIDANKLFLHHELYMIV